MSHPQPLLSITVDGQDITSVVTDRLINLTLTDNRGFETDQLDLVMNDSDGQIDLPPRGALIAVAIGWESSGLVDKGSYVVDEIEHSGAPDQLAIRARSADLRGGLTTQMERSFHRVTLGGIVRIIADENDLTPVIAPNLDAEWIEHEDQTNESSANLLTRLALRFDAIASVKDNKLLFIPAGAGKSASGKTIPVTTIFRVDGDQHRFSLAEREAYTAVRATYYDTHVAKKGEIVWGKEEEAEAKGKRQPVASPLASSQPKFKALPGTYKSRKLALRACVKAWNDLKQRAGWDGVKAAYEDRVNKIDGEPVKGWASYGYSDEEKKNKNAVALAIRDAQKLTGAKVASGSDFDHSADNIKTLRHVYAGKENAKRAARSEYLRLGRGTAIFSITLAVGRPELFPDVPVSVSGFKPAIDGTDWIVSRVTHNITDSGYTTGLELEIRTSNIPG